jgi:hypothetical protein
MKDKETGSVMLKWGGESLQYSQRKDFVRMLYAVITSFDYRHGQGFFSSPLRPGQLWIIPLTLPSNGYPLAVR